MAFGSARKLDAKKQYLLSKKRIAVLIDWYLPGNKAGGPVKSIYSLLNVLNEQYDFFVITRNNDLGSFAPYKNVECNKWTKFKDTTIYYFSNENLNKNNLAAVINEISPDFVYLNSFWSYFFSIVPLQLKKQNKINAKVILAPRGMLSRGAISIKPVKKQLYLFLSKFSKVYNDLLFHATTDNEEKEIQNYFPKAKIKIASNVNSTLVSKNKKSEKQSGELKLFYLSRVARVKNLLFALNILKEIKTEGSIVYDIYGSLEDATYWEECEKVIQSLPPNIKVNYKYEIDYEDVPIVIANYHFLFLPTLNENFGHTIVESLVSGCPVIITDQTPWDINKNNCGFAISLNKKEEFKSAILGAIQINDTEYKKMSENCVTFIEQKINIKENIQAYSELFL